MEPGDLIVVALGGNAIQLADDDSVVSDFSHTAETAERLASLLQATQARLVVTHGNGPQVGNHLLRSQLGHEHGHLPLLPLDVCVADTEEEGDTTETRAFISIQNAVPGGEHPWHVHVGQCGQDRGAFGPAEAYEPLRVGGNGEAESLAEIPVPVPTAGQYFVKVHASRNNMGTTIACGNLAPPSR